MNNQNPYTPAPGQGGRFCIKCGAPLDANGMCPNCAKQANPQPFPQQNAPQFNYQQPAQPQGYNYGQPSQFQPQQQQNIPQQGYTPYPSKAPAGPNIFTYALDYIKAFFTPDPTKVLDKAVNEKQYVWSILGSGSILLVTLGIFGIMLNGINKISDLVYGLISGFSGMPFLGNALGGTSQFQSELTGIKVKLFFFTLLVVAAFFFASAGLDTLFFSLQKKKSGYVQNLNSLSAAMLPLAVCGAGAFLLSFIYIPLSLILLVAGLFFKYILLYDGLKKAADFDRNPIWYVFGLVAANIVSFALIAYILSQFMF